MPTYRFIKTLTVVALIAMIQSTAYGFFLDGAGHYGLRGESRVKPGFSDDSGIYQAIEQSFRLEGEARFNDKSSLFLEFSLFDNPREAYLGDTAQPNDCVPRRTSTGVDTNCEGRHQNTGEPRYKPFTPRVTKAYVRYAFDYCILEAGRRGRNWGMGIFLNDGDTPFETDASIFDGLTCNINVQKSQTLGFSIGYDKLAETGTYIDNPYDYPFSGNNKAEQDFDTRTRKFGANDTGDDISQFFFTVEYDDRKANAGAAFTKQIGLYFSQITSKKLNKNGSNTDLQFLDLYTGFFFTDIAFRNELLFRMGKSADPNWYLLGGSRTTNEGTPAVNKLQAIALAGDIEWTISRSGANLGPAEFNRGDARRHVLALDYAYAPGDEDGYFTDKDGITPDQSKLYGEAGRDQTASAVSLHRNYKPALILFNARPEADGLRVDGAFNPSRVTNASLLGLTYRYENLKTGNIAVKLLTAQLLAAIPGSVKDYYASLGESAQKPIGYFGKSLGYELDITYEYHVGREVELGLAGAVALPGDAWKTHEKTDPVNTLLLQTYAVFKF